jgi:hypothetical protein
MVPRGGAYGQRQALEGTQRALPLADEESRFASAIQAAVREPGVQGLIGRESERPGEPVTSGLPVGPGPGPESLPLDMVDGEDDPMGFLLALYQVEATPELELLLQVADGVI